MWIDEPRIFTEITRSRVGGPVHVIGGPNEFRLTLYSQQCRALNLVCALRQRYDGLEKRRIAVIGAGAAGLTAATALRAIGVPRDHLTIYEQSASPLYTQRWSFKRFLHPRLFHWPERHWDKGQADIPVGDWTAGYAADVREQILSDCTPLDVEFCTLVKDVVPSTGRDEAATVIHRRLDESACREERFELVLVATGFPSEQPVEATVGGTYWHSRDGLDELRGSIHVIGDGDGGLTEILMMLIDRFGHAAIEQLCRRLPLDSIDRLHAKDLEAQGNPSARADLERKDIECPDITKLFENLNLGSDRNIAVHAKNPLSGSSFLLNRALVTHMLWMARPAITLQKGGVKESEVASLNGTVIWRAGIGERPLPDFAVAQLSSKQAACALNSAQANAVSRGLLVGLVDGLRRPMWSDWATRKLRDGSSDNRGWKEGHAGRLSRVTGEPSVDADALLNGIAATAQDLKRVGITELDLLPLEDELWVSIDQLACAGDCPHQTLVEPASSASSGRSEPGGTAPHGTVSELRRDGSGRLWFRLPSDPSSDTPQRGAVRVLVSRAALSQWAHRSAKRRIARKRDGSVPPAIRSLSLETLKGLGDIAAGSSDGHRANLQLATIHEAIGDWDATKNSLLRAGRRPGGVRLSAAGPDVNVRLRRIMLRLARATVRLAPDDDQLLVQHTVWHMFAGAAADLVTLFGGEELLLDLETSSAFLREIWAPRVRGISRPHADLPRVNPPDWAEALEDAAARLPRAAERTKPVREARLRELANEALRLAERETLGRVLVTPSELGVWPVARNDTSEIFP